MPTLIKTSLPNEFDSLVSPPPPQDPRRQDASFPPIDLQNLSSKEAAALQAMVAVLNPGREFNFEQASQYFYRGGDKELRLSNLLTEVRVINRKEQQVLFAYFRQDGLDICLSVTPFELTNFMVGNFLQVTKEENGRTKIYIVDPRGSEHQGKVMKASFYWSPDR
jgi:hypothetical protein